MDLRKFRKRLRSLYNFWMKHRHGLLGAADVLVVSTLSPPPSSNAEITMSSAFFKWLFGYNLANTVAVFSSSEIHFLCDPKKASILQSLKDTVKAAVGASLVVHVNAKAVGRQSNEVDEIVRMAVLDVGALDSALKLRRKKLDEDNGDWGTKVVVGCMEEMVQEKVFRGNKIKKTTKGIDLEWKDVEGGYARLLRLKNEGEKVEEKEAVDKVKAKLAAGSGDGYKNKLMKAEKFMIGDEWIVV